MKTEKEIREYLDKLYKYKERLLRDFTPDHEINEVDAEINTILWVLEAHNTFNNVTKCLDQFSSVANSENAMTGDFNEEEMDILEYFELHLAEALMKERFIDAAKLAKIILAAKGDKV